MSILALEYLAVKRHITELAQMFRELNFRNTQHLLCRMVGRCSRTPAVTCTSPCHRIFVFTHLSCHQVITSSTSCVQTATTEILIFGLHSTSILLSALYHKTRLCMSPVRFLLLKLLIIPERLAFHQLPMRAGNHGRRLYSTTRMTAFTPRQIIKHK